MAWRKKYESAGITSSDQSRKASSASHAREYHLSYKAAQQEHKKAIKVK